RARMTLISAGPVCGEQANGPSPSGRATTRPAGVRSPLRLVALDRPGDRDLRGPSEVLQRPRCLTLAVRDAEFLADHPGDPVTGPEVAPEAVRLGAMPEEVGDQADLLGVNLRGAPRRSV